MSGTVLWTSGVGLLAVAAIVGALEARAGRPARIGLAASAIAGIAIAGFGLVLLWSGEAVELRAGEVLGFAPVAVRYDALAGVFVALLGIVTTGASLFGIGYVGHGHPSGDEPWVAAAYPTFIVALLLVFGAADAFAFLLAWELMAIVSAILVVGTHPTRESLGAGYIYLIATHIATAAIVVAFGVMAASGGGLDLGSLAAGAAALPPLGRDIVFVLLVVGFGTKAGAVPLHGWLPHAHPVAPSHVSALMSGVMVTAGIFGLMRFAWIALGPGPDWWGLALVAIGGVSAVLGVLYAAADRDLKRVLAFSTVENVGVMLLGLGAALIARAHHLDALAALALGAVLFQVLAHGLAKSLLFLGAGSVQSAAGGRDLDRLGGLIRGMPWTAALTGLGAATLAGLPPLAGFAGEWLTFQALVGTASSAGLPAIARFAAILGVGALALAAALAVACFVRVLGMTFLALPRSRPAELAREVGRPMRAGMTFLAILALAAGLGAGPLGAAVRSVAATVASPGATTRPLSASSAALARDVLTGVLPAGGYAPATIGVVLIAGVLAASLVALLGASRTRREETWTCGVAPEPAFEYTATSFAKPTLLFFRRALRPAREVRVELHEGTPFPRSIHYRSAVTLVLEERVFGPLQRAGIAGSQLARRLQNGSLQLYLAYTVTALVALLLLARVVA